MNRIHVSIYTMSKYTIDDIKNYVRERIVDGETLEEIYRSVLSCIKDYSEYTDEYSVDECNFYRRVCIYMQRCM